MHELAKNTCFLLVFMGGVVAAFAWTASGHSTGFWLVRICSAAVAVLGMCGFVALHFRHDRVPDYLLPRFPDCFEREGICVAIVPRLVDGGFCIDVIYQGKYSRPCVCKVALRPAARLLRRAGSVCLEICFDCAAAGFGIVCRPWPIPPKWSGKRTKFELGLSVSYPDGRGRQVRFRNGLRVGCSAKFKSDALISFVKFGDGHYRPATVLIDFPHSCESSPSDNLSREVVFWQLGEPPLTDEDIALALTAIASHTVSGNLLASGIQCIGKPPFP